MDVMELSLGVGARLWRIPREYSRRRCPERTSWSRRAHWIPGCSPPIGHPGGDQVSLRL